MIDVVWSNSLHMTSIPTISIFGEGKDYFSVAPAVFPHENRKKTLNLGPPKLVGLHVNKLETL